MKDFYIGLLFGCPLDDERENCPFAEIRKKNIRDRIEWDLERSEDEKEALIAHHKNCLKLREKI